MRFRDPLHTPTRTAREAPHARIACVAFLALAVACGSGDEAPAAQAAQAAERLNARQEVTDPARDFRLTMDHVRRFARASENVMQRGAEDPAFRARVEAAMDEVDDDEALDDVVRRLEADRELRRELDRAGISARDYLLTIMSLTAVSMYASMRDMGWEGEPSEWVTERNLAFFEENREEIEQVMSRVQEMDRELYGDDDDW